VRSSASSLYFQYSLISLRSFSSWLHLLHCLPMTSIFSWITHSRRLFLHKKQHIQLAFHRFIACRIFRSSLTRNTSFFTWSGQLIFSSTIFQNFPVISDLLYKASTFQHHTKLCSKYSSLVVFPLNLKQICWRKDYSSCGMMLELHWCKSMSNNNHVPWMQENLYELLHNQATINIQFC